MTTLGVPDLLLSNRISRDLGQVNADLVRASNELATGLRQDPVAASGGDPSRLYALDRDIAAVVGIVREVDRAGRAFADAVDDDVFTDLVGDVTGALDFLDRSGHFFSRSVHQPPQKNQC